MASKKKTIRSRCRYVGKGRSCEVSPTERKCACCSFDQCAFGA